MRLRLLLVLAICACSLAAPAPAVSAVHYYVSLGDSLAAGAQGTALTDWPASTHLARQPESFTAIVVLHPECPCSQATVEELDNVHEIGLTMAQSIHDWFADPGNARLCERLRQAGVRTELEKLAAKSEPQTFAGKIFVLTGSLPTLTRDEATQLIEARGGRVTSSVSKKTDFVVAGEEARSRDAVAGRVQPESQWDGPAFANLPRNRTAGAWTRG